MIGKRKIVLVGTGFVGMSMAYAIVSQGASSGVNELVLIDVMKEKAIGEAMDLAHGLPCSSSHMKIKAGDYDECEDADIEPTKEDKFEKTTLEQSKQMTVFDL